MDIEKLELKKRLYKMRLNLPYLYAFDWYQYQRDFLDTTKEWQFLCCANQLGKSTVLVAKLTTLALDQEKWDKLWVDRPDLFLYFLPNQKLHNENAETKWKSVLPKGEMKDHIYYGWDWDKRGKDYLGITFKNGVRIRFLSYGQKTDNMQNMTCHVIAFDEEPPKDIVSEVQTRTQAIRVAEQNVEHAYGGFKMFAFTATKSQDYFRKIIEVRGDGELMPESEGNVYKRTVSLYDCQKHISGKLSQWTNEKIDKIIKALPTRAEIKRRVYGRFQASEGLIYQNFDAEKNTTDIVPVISTNWYIYAGIDYGAGGRSHPSAIVFVAVNPKHTLGYVIKSWRGEGELTTCDDVILKYIELSKGLKISAAYYDWAAKDLMTFATRRSVSIIRANKDREVGRNILNGLFKSQMLQIVSNTYHNNELTAELGSLVTGTNKKSMSVQDHLTDALRYATSLIPWDFSNPRSIKEDSIQLYKAVKTNRLKRRDGRYTDEFMDFEPDYSIEGEYNEWKELFE